MDHKHDADDKAEAPETPFKPHIPKLLPVPKGLVKPNDRLCTICEAFKLTPHDFFVLKGDKEREKKMKEGEPEMVCGALSDIIKKRVNCPLCRLIYKSLGEEVPKQGRGKLSTIIVSLRWMTRPGSNKPPFARTLSIKLSSSSQTDSDRETLHNLFAKRLFPSIGILANDALGPIPTKFKSYVGRAISKDKINFRMVRNWVDICVSRHSESCSGMPTLLAPLEVRDAVDDIPSLRMVDVIDNCIVLAPRNCKYCALSYVWGRIDPKSILTTLMDNVAELEKPGALADPKNHDKIPLTIRDAMYVVEKLGMRYLWTDTLCIIQDDLGKGGTKMQAISKMNVVYGMAVLTIIAASGKDAHAGLPGVHTGSKRSQLIEEISPGLRLCYMDTYQDHIHDAVYYTRGWTYQEKAFSKRSLLFAGNQVTYICGMFENCREDRPCEKEHADPQSKGHSYYDGRDDDIGKIEGTLSSYSKLSLTYDSDIYHCMAAAMNILVKRLLDGHLCHGTPDVFFDWFLLWEPWVVLKRRSVTPSWSWTGWEGRTTTRIWSMCGREISGVREQHRERSWIIWYQRKAHDSDEYIRVGSDANDLSPNVKEKLFSCDCTMTLPTPRFLTGAPVYLEDTYNPQPASGFLQFWTVSVLFDLREATSSDDRRETRHGHARAGIFGRSTGRELGTILLDPTWYQAHVPGQHEFIILCEARVDTSKDGKRSNSDWLFKMMLIEWCGQRQWAERVGVSAIDKSDLKEGLEDGPVWKEIVLG